MSSTKRVITADRAERQYWRDLWRFRELLAFLAWRDVAVRYKQTVIGVAWAIVRPIVTVVIMVVVFGKIANLPSGGVPYPLLVLAGMLAWQLFSTGFSAASDSLVTNGNLISKVYFPRLVIPLSSIAVSLVDFLVTLPLLVVLMFWYGATPTWNMLLFPVFVLLALVAALSVGLWLSALNVKYRDVRFVIPFVIQFGVYVSPVGFSTTAVPEQYQWLFSLNPVTAIIEGFRWTLLGQSDGLTPLSLAVCLGTIAVLLFTGVRYFRRTEQSFADVI